MLRLGLVLFIFMLSSIARAETNSCPPSVAAEIERTEIIACVQRCNAVFGNQREPVTQYFARQCKKSMNAIHDSQSLGGAARISGRLAIGVAAQCAPQAVKKAVMGIPEFVMALPSLVSAWLGSSRNPPEHLKKLLESCDEQSVCKRSVARNTDEFRRKNSDGTWMIKDADLDRRIESRTMEALVNQATLDHQRAKNDCQERWTALQKQIAPDGSWTVERKQSAYDRMSRASGGCVELLAIKSPEEEKADPLLGTLDTSSLYAVGTICFGEDFLVETCAEVGSAMVPLPGRREFTILKSATGLRKAEDMGSAVSSAARNTELAREASNGAAASTTLTAPDIAASGASKTTTADGMKKINSANTPALTASASTLRAEVIRKYDGKVYASEAQNQKFITICEGAENAGANKPLVVSIENSVMKSLNDGTGDKSLITAVTNLHKEILLKNFDALKSKYPGLKVEPYSDFKSVQFAIDDGSLSAAARERLLKDLDGVLQSSNREFARTARRLEIHADGVGDPETWFRGGSGRGVDEGATAARRAREVGDGRLLDFDSPEVKEAMTERLAKIEDQRQALVKDPAMQKLLDREDPGVVVPEARALDLVRKYKDPEELAGAVREQYKLKDFDANQAKQLKEYASGVNELSPAILIAKRESLGFDAAELGGASTDFLGMGSANLHATAKGIAGGKDLTAALKGARAGEKSVTSEFRRRMEKFEKTVGGDVKCSGDDCVQIAKATMTDREKIHLLSKVAADPDTRAVRMSFIGPGVAPAERMQLATQGELIEKSLRKELSGRIDPDKLRNLTFGLDMKSTKLGEGEVNLIIGRGGGRLSPKDLEQIQQAFGQTLDKANKSGRDYAAGAVATKQSQLILIPGAGLIRDPESKD